MVDLGFTAHADVVVADATAVVVVFDDDDDDDEGLWPGVGPVDTSNTLTSKVQSTETHQRNHQLRKKNGATETIPSSSLPMSPPPQDYLPLWFNGLPSMRTRRGWHGVVGLERFQPEIAQLASETGLKLWSPDL
mmetsp:Transcript_37347/g.48318  ORF Transcript_37347/g.48318 Transcript_37347/m.48318 type:complete len:134 (-) Transcript_37347:124-525(-)